MPFLLCRQGTVQLSSFYIVLLVTFLIFYYETKIAQKYCESLLYQINMPLRQLDLQIFAMINTSYFLVNSSSYQVMVTIMDVNYFSYNSHFPLCIKVIQQTGMDCCCLFDMLHEANLMQCGVYLTAL